MQSTQVVISQISCSSWPGRDRMNDRSFDSNTKRLPGMEIMEVTPVILGGDPEDPNNKTVVTREQHFELVRYWNGVIRQLKASPRI